MKRSKNFLQIFFSHIFETFRSGSYKGHFAKVLETIDNSLRQNIVMKNFSKGKKKFEGEPDYQIHWMNWGIVAVKRN